MAARDKILQKQNVFPKGTLIRGGLIYSILALSVLLASWNTACSTRGIVPTPTLVLACPTLKPTETPFQYPIQIPTEIPPTWVNPFNNWQGVVVYALFLENQVNVGTEQNFIIESVPAFLQSAPSLTWVQSWPDHNVAEMRACLSLDTPCTPDGPWIPFGTSSDAKFSGGFRISETLTVDWTERRSVWIGVQFRDTFGNPVAAVDGEYNLMVNPEPQEILQMKREVSGLWDQTLPLTEQPPAVQTVVAITEVAYPVTGSVDIGPGREVAGGIAGEPLNMKVAFNASSPFGTVTEMRAGSCLIDYIAESAWEPYVTEKTYPLFVSINWTTFTLGVQYRDDKGNLSRVYCDHLAVEGSPAMPTPISTEWVSQIACFAENEVRPGPGETVSCDNVLFMWPVRNFLTKGILYEVNIFDADTGTSIAKAGTSETSIAIQIPHAYAGELVWYVSLHTDLFGALNHNRCSSTIPASLITLQKPDELQGVHFWYKP